MCKKAIWMWLLAAFLVAGQGMASEICTNGIDDDSNGAVDCDDVACLSDSSCDLTDDCSEDDISFVEEGRDGVVVVKTRPGRSGQCSGNATDSDGKDPLVAGCLTYWTTSACGAPATGNAWDFCASPTRLQEIYTLHADKKSCATPSTGLERDCETWLDWQGITCPANSMAVCVSQPLNCGGVQRQGGFCACTTPAKGEEGEIVKEP